MQINYSDEIYEKNRDAFQARYGILVPQIDVGRSKYSIEEAKNGEPVLYVNVDASHRIRLNSIYNPSYEALEWAKGREKQQRRTSVILCGLSTGVYLRALFNTFRADTSFYVFEPDEKLFEYICSSIDISDLILNKRIYLFIYDDQKNRMIDIVHNDVICNRPEVVGIITPFYSNDEFFSNACEQIGRLSVALRNFKKTRGRNALRCRLYAWNHIEGSLFLSDLAKVFPDDIPAVIISAGPSLNGNVDELKKLKGHAFLLSTDRALSTLKEHEILPDAVISVDAEKSADYLKYAFDNKIPVICSYQLNIDSQRKAKGNLIYFDAISYEKKLFGDRASLGSGIDMGGNVAGGAYVVLKLLGVKKIIFAGQDLAYKDGKHHADGIEDGMDGIEDSIEVEGVDGKKVLTTKMWLKYRDFFVRQIKQNPEIECIDATEGGAFIEGSKVMALSEVTNLFKEKQFRIEDVYKQLNFGINDELAEKAKNIISGWISDLEEISDLSGKLEKSCKTLLRLYKVNPNSEEMVEELDRMDALRKSLYSLEMNNMLEEFWVEDMYSIPPKVMYMQNASEAKTVLEEAEEYYGNLINDALSLKETMQK
ncbi:motility associated factor glycosyltransferase family protein [Butyrivibrio sp. NC2002]|uniref:motility associated factor glycosyltransferase family protein n=1 Tax=Butyrivibrio sp. NC2002 TaxID=1410610 RepID=UPI0005641D7B|nr:6-hydroxymethylpterin diphosphokinase MptE-like protein [Butyrivibrio sp. NC2002]